jgi:hypothetical protein
MLKEGSHQFSSRTVRHHLFARSHTRVIPATDNEVLRLFAIDVAGYLSIWQWDANAYIWHSVVHSECIRPESTGTSLTVVAARVCDCASTAQLGCWLLWLEVDHNDESKLALYSRRAFNFVGGLLINEHRATVIDDELSSIDNDDDDVATGSTVAASEIELFFCFGFLLIIVAARGIKLRNIAKSSAKNTANKLIGRMRQVFLQQLCLMRVA